MWKVLLAIAIVASSGCKKSETTVTKDDPKASTKASASSSVSAGDDDDDDGAKNVTKGACHEWAGKFVEVTRAAMHDDMRKCGRLEKEAGVDDKLEAQSEKAADDAFDEVIVKQGDELEKGCITQVGKSYIARDARCFMKGKALADWGECHFKTPFFADFGDLGSTFDRKVMESCKQGMAGAKGSVSDDDDDDDDAKKKIKK